MREQRVPFGEAEFEQYRKTTRREHFLAEMQCVVPWAKR